MALEDFYNFRAELVRSLRKDLMGPVAPDEVIQDNPALHYGVGILFPSQSGKLSESEDGDLVSDSGVDDSPVAFANIKYPSSLGITFAVDLTRCTSVVVTPSGAEYYPIPEALLDAEKAPGYNHGDAPSELDEGAVQNSLEGESETEAEAEAEERTLWKRRELPLESVQIDLNEAATRYFPVAENVELFVRIRIDRTSQIASVTTVLINKRRPSAQGFSAKSEASIFQAKLSIESHDQQAVFVERPKTGLNDSDKDLQVYSLIYREAREFATGHGCAATWTLLDHSDRATKIETEYLPEYRLPLADSNPALNHLQLSMSFFASASQSEGCDRLRGISEAYAKWIAEKRTEVTKDEYEKYREIANENLALCDEARQRIESGIALLESNPEAWRAFALMNKAMWTQRARTEWVKRGREGASPEEDQSHFWRPFQMAFILMTIKGVVDPVEGASERDIVDLLWFPTGGGKTEAYLGLIAFTIFNRRLTNEDGGGVTAMMRYTLRLLTLQQFERAASLICACEVLRQADLSALGEEPISIGLWLGNNSTPGTMEKAQKALNLVQAGQSDVEGNPVQLTKCPWCGASISSTDYWITADGKHLKIRCSDRTCAFRGGIPAYVVDEEIYTDRPTLLISTADKFANLPWRDDVRSLFNLKWRDKRAQLPPELIVQDELHLISGPLGSLAGLYETAVDSLCTRNGIRPKVVASTATIRRADSQIKNLFDRGMRQFPPSALDASDSFFAVESDPNVKGDRMYLGVMSPSNSHATLLIRTYATLMQSVSTLEGIDEVRDQYWTLVGYFNSLRILGAARMQVQDDVPARIALISGRSGDERRTTDQIIELTSNISASEIPTYLEQIAFSKEMPGAVDAIMATNMISVGVDVDRLGLMVVMGQPQSTSEYIQSTSRVGRRNPGLVVTLYNSAKSRDRSHYESFMSYHSAMYRQVEATSVTPFSPRSRSRGLHAVLISLARAKVDALSSNDAAVDVSGYLEELRTIKAEIVERVRRVSPEEASQAASQIDQILNLWKRRGEGGLLKYYQYLQPDKSLLTEATDTESIHCIQTLRSLRDVDKESKLFILNR